MEDFSARRSRSRNRNENPENLEEYKGPDKQKDINESLINTSRFISESEYEQSVLGEKPDSKLDETRNRYEELTPYGYQSDIFDKIKQNWSKESVGNRYGNIVFLETGTGKTYIAIMLLKAIFYEDCEKKGLSDVEMNAQARETATGATLKPLEDSEIKDKYDLRHAKITRFDTL
jgi:type I site-specific restriction endonuclease